MKIVDLAGHEWWNPVADISAAVSDVVGAASDIPNAASNTWDSLPPGERIGVVAAAIDVGTIGSIFGDWCCSTRVARYRHTTEDTEGLDADALAASAHSVNSLRGYVNQLQGQAKS